MVSRFKGVEGLGRRGLSEIRKGGVNEDSGGERMKRSSRSRTHGLYTDDLNHALLAVLSERSRPTRGRPKSVKVNSDAR
jgi:hypothetical protein